MSWQPLLSGILFSASLYLTSIEPAQAGEWAVPGAIRVGDDARPIQSAGTQPALAPATGRPAEGAASSLQFVKPSTSASGAAPSGSGTVLRWRGRKLNEASPKAADSQVAAGVWQDRVTKSTGSVRVVSYDEPVDVFKDPFGDRGTQTQPAAKPKTVQAADPDAAKPAELTLPLADGPAVETPQTETPGSAAPSTSKEKDAPPAMDSQFPVREPAEPKLSAPATDESAAGKPATPDLLVPPAEVAKPAAVAPLTEKPAQDDSDSAPPPPGLGPQPKVTLPVVPTQPRTTLPVQPRERQSFAPSPLTGPPSSFGPGESDRAAEKAKCGALYNDRNCCEDSKKCEAARQAVRQASIKKINLDITASFKPDAESVAEQDEARNNQLRQMPARSWKNREGQVVAEGRLTELHNRRVHITSERGQVATIPLHELSDDDVCFLTAWWGVPSECHLGDEQFAGRAWEPMSMTWKASGVGHKPLYFEQVQLERYGHTVGPLFESPLAGAHFFASAALLPYQMGIHPPMECQYALGYYRPGSCAPWLLPQFPLSLRGAVAQADAIVGGIFLIPW